MFAERVIAVMVNLQPTLGNELVQLHPLREEDFERLFKVASDPLIWEQHPNPDRYKREVFSIYFEGAIQSGGAFLILDAKSGEAIGCSRFYDYEPGIANIKIGYTFLAREYWGGVYNPAIKKLMLDHAFTFAKHVIFHVGASNIRSQKAMERIGGIRIGEEKVAYHGEQNSVNVVYRISRST